MGIALMRIVWVVRAHTVWDADRDINRGMVNAFELLSKAESVNKAQKFRRVSVQLVTPTTYFIKGNVWKWELLLVVP